jgi:hypothetical protein
MTYANRSERQKRLRIGGMFLACLMLFSLVLWQITVGQADDLAFDFLGPERPVKSGYSRASGSVYLVRVYSWRSPFEKSREHAVAELLAKGFIVTSSEPFFVCFANNGDEIIVAAERQVGSSVFSSVTDENYVMVFVSQRKPGTALNHLRSFFGDPEMHGDIEF